jgi:uncharacterized protein
MPRKRCMRLSPCCIKNYAEAPEFVARLAMKYIAPWWLPGGNLQTIWSALYARRVRAVVPIYQRERWDTPDGDFIDVDWLHPSGSAGLLVLFHGLEGTSRSHYAEAFADYAQRHNLAYAVPHFRGCSGELNLAPRAYHSGDYEEVGWILQQMRKRCAGPIMVVGISLGGNALLRWAQEAEGTAAHIVSSIASVCSPLDLAASGHAMGRGFNRGTYNRMFLRTMKPKALRKLEQYPRLFDASALMAAQDLYAFDNVFTAPLHGYKNTEDYWSRASAKPHLGCIRIPSLVLNAVNDPFVPAESLPRVNEVGPWVTLWQPQQGGHVGFVQGRLPGHVQAMPEAVGDWLRQHAQGGLYG